MGYVTDTSAAAAASIQEHLARLENLVYGEISAAGADGVCCFEIEQKLSMIHQTASARITELQVKRLIKDSTRRRLTPSRRQAIVWIVRKKPSVEEASHDPAI